MISSENRFPRFPDRALDLALLQARDMDLAPGSSRMRRLMRNRLMPGRGCRMGDMGCANETTAAPATETRPRDVRTGGNRLAALGDHRLVEMMQMHREG